MTGPSLAPSEARSVAIIMDGNGRWAAARGLLRLLAQVHDQPEQLVRAFHGGRLDDARDAQVDAGEVVDADLLLSLESVFIEFKN